MKLLPRFVRYSRVGALSLIAVIALHACCTVPLPAGNAKFALTFTQPVKVGVSQRDFMCALRRHALSIPLTKIFFNRIPIPLPFDCPRDEKIGWQTADNSKDNTGGPETMAIHVGQVVYFQTATALQDFLKEIKVQAPDR